MDFEKADLIGLGVVALAVLYFLAQILRYFVFLR